MSENVKYLVFLILCISSRLITSIYYIEDIDSLRFALAANEFDVTKQQPHFPGYPLYCYILNLLQFTIGNVGICFSFIGGCSIFLIFYFLSKITKLFVVFKNDILLFLIVFTHPFLWIMSNRYMPDILGLGLLLAATYFFLKGIKNPKLNYFIVFGLLLGAECGVRLSYIPFFIPIIFYAFNEIKNIGKIGVGFFLGVGIWLLPFVFDVGWDELLSIGMRNTKGHFLEWGGTVSSNSDSYFIRMAGFFRSIWLEGMVGWFPGRSILTISSSVIWLMIVAFVATFLIKRKYSIGKFAPILWCLLFYSIWIFFFQNIVYKPRHIIPFIPFILLIPIWLLSKYLKTLYTISIATLLLISNSIICANLVADHKEPSAISQSKDWIEKNKKENWIFYSTKLKNFYYRKHEKISGLKFVSVDNEAYIFEKLREGKIICSDINLDKALNCEPFSKHIFYHNPNVNRLWSKIVIRTYKY